MFGLFGLQISQSIADMLTFIMATMIVTGILKELNQLRDKKETKNSEDMETVKK